MDKLASVFHGYKNLLWRQKLEAVCWTPTLGRSQYWQIVYYETSNNKVKNETTI